jgi:hypothetical protein
MDEFYDFHDGWFLLFMFFFPRATMLFWTTVGAGPLYWLGWLMAPRFTVAVIATHCFGHENTDIVVFAWIWAFFGEVIEKAQISKGDMK